MQRYLIQRDLPGAGTLSTAQLRDIARTSNAVIRGMGPGIQWIRSFVTANQLCCEYLAQSEDLLHEHAKRGGFPITRVLEVAGVFDPLTERAPATT